MWRCSAGRHSCQRYQLTSRGRGVLAVIGIIGLVALAGALFELTAVLVALVLPFAGVVIAVRTLRQRIRGRWTGHRDGKPTSTARGHG